MMNVNCHFLDLLNVSDHNLCVPTVKVNATAYNEEEVGIEGLNNI